MKKKILVFYIIIALVLLSSNVYAAFNVELTLDKDKTSVKAGEEIIVFVNLKNISEKVSSVKGYIDVDENVLSGVSENMIVKNSKGKVEVISNGEVTNELSYAYAPNSLTEANLVFNLSDTARKDHDVFFDEDFPNDLSKDSVILKLKFNVKDGIQDGNLEKAVSVSGLTAESSKEVDGTFVTEKVENLSADVTIVVKNDKSDPQDNENKNADNENKNTDNENKNVDNTNKNTDNQNKNVDNTNKNTNTNTNNTNKNTNNSNTKNTNTNTNKDNTVSGNRLPATGAKTIIIPGVIIALLCFVSYKKYMNYKDV